MKKALQLLALVVLASNVVQAAPQSTDIATRDRTVIVDPSSMPVGLGKATLTIGALRRTEGVYCGEYKIKVSPYFFKNEKGTLAIVVSDASLARMTLGKVATITGVATPGGKGAKARHIDATATPVDTNRGTLKLWFLAGDRRMIFEPTYHFVNNTTSDLP